MRGAVDRTPAAARSRAPGAAPARGPAHAHDGIVHVPHDRPVVDEEHVRDAARAARAPRVRRCRSARRSGCRSWPRPGIRARPAAGDAAGCTAASPPGTGCPAPPRPSASRARLHPSHGLTSALRLRGVGRVAPCVSSLEQDDRRFRRRSSVASALAHVADRAHRVERRKHQRERLLLAGLRVRAAGARPASLRASTTRWKPPSPLTRDDLARARSALPGREQRLVARSARRVTVRDPTARAAGRTPGRRWAARGSGGRAGRGTPPGTPRTSRTRPSSCSAGRTAAPR